MKYDKYQYNRIFEIIKNKIESGLMPKGTVLPSYADLCKEYKVSDKTIRRVVAMRLTQDSSRQKKGSFPWLFLVRQNREVVPNTI